MTEWTVEMKVRALLRLPWTIVPGQDADDRCLTARVAEIPGVIGVGHDSKSLEDDFYAALGAAFDELLAAGDAIPLPVGVYTYPWERKLAARVDAHVSLEEGEAFANPQMRTETGGSSSALYTV